MTVPTPVPAQPVPAPVVIAPAPVAAVPAPIVHSFWASFFQKLINTEEALYPIFVPSNDAKAQGIAAAVLVTTSTFASIFGVHPTNPSV
jgi:hypothetical protein